MKPTWKVVNILDFNSSHCECLICGKQFTIIEDSHFNMGLIKCSTCNQEVWVPRCPRGCLPFEKETERSNIDLLD